MGHGGGACGDVVLAAGRRGRVAGLLMSPMRLGCTPAPRTPPTRTPQAQHAEAGAREIMSRVPCKALLAPVVLARGPGGLQNNGAPGLTAVRTA